jgi:hypothetical protein
MPREDKIREHDDFDLFRRFQPGLQAKDRITSTA